MTPQCPHCNAVGHLRDCQRPRQPLWPLAAVVAAALIGSCPAPAHAAECAPSYHDPIGLTHDERRIIDAAMQCPRATDPDPWLLRDLLLMERLAGVPDELRGMVLAAACWESGFRPAAIGDAGRAVGIVQLWPWARVDRRDPVASARFWLGHVATRMPKVRRECGLHGEAAWVAAWVTAIRAPRPGGRCGERPRHLQLLRAWRGNRNGARVRGVLAAAWSRRRPPGPNGGASEAR